MNYKPPRHKRHKSRPIEDLLPHSKHILLTLLEGEKNVNEVFRKLQQTGFSYKRDVLDAIESLKNGGVLSKKQGSDNSTKRILSLTGMGKDIANLIVNVETYTQSWSKLDKATTERFDTLHIMEDVIGSIREGLSTERALHAFLRTKGWNKDEVNRFLDDRYEPSAGISYVLEQSPSVVINILLYKYVMFLGMNMNDLAKKIIQTLIINLMATVLQCMPVMYPKGSNKTDSVTDRVSELVIGHTAPVILGGGFMYHFMNKEVSEVLGSMFSIVQPRKEFIKNRIGTRIETIRTKVGVKSDFEGRPKSTPKFNPDQYLSNAIPFYEEVVRKWS